MRSVRVSRSMTGPARAIVVAGSALFAGQVMAQAINPIVGATSAPPIVTRNGLFAPPIYGSGYGSPYGSGSYPYQSFNSSTQGVTNPQQNSGQPTVPGQSQLPSNLEGGGGGGGGGNGGGGNGGGSNGGGGGGNVQSNPSAAQGASYEVMQDANSPLYKRYERIDPKTEQLRPQILEQIGRGKGIRQGFIDEAHRISASIEATAAARFDARFDFTRQMIGAHLVPPVIGEVHDVEERAGDRVLYLTVGAYQIVRPARLVLTPPNWRDYLFVEPADPQTAISALAPNSGEERSRYDAAYEQGMTKGIQEARDTFEDNLNRLERDYAGMERFHELARQGAVSLPVVADRKRAVRVADDGQRAFVGEQVVTLRVSPSFKAARKSAFK